MMREFEEFIESRCEQALLENKEYIRIQNEFDAAYKSNSLETYSELSMQMIVLIESVCYKLAIKDIYTFICNN